MLQGVTTAAGRVVGVAVVRDMYAGRRMAEVMSLAMTVFMIVPILAPGVGQLFLAVGEWRDLFALLSIFGFIMVAWVAIRLPETLAPEKRTPLAPATVVRAFGEVLRHRIPLGYMIASLLMFAAPMAYLSSADQIFSETFGLGELFPLAFGAVALSLAAASIANARLVGRYGMRLISHSAACLFVAASFVHLIVVLAGLESLPVFMGLQMIAFFGVGLMLSNFTSLALEPMGHVAGVASSALGFATMCGSALLGGFIAHRYDGTTTPLVIGFAATSIAVLAVVAITEKGRLFASRPRAEAAAE
jgi:DHA1 family bicyclomycin/chloramphenicol resistance-like MFS transporter